MAFLNTTIRYVDCEGCGVRHNATRACENCKRIERLKYIDCPSCDGSNINEESVNESNGVYGPGSSSWSVFAYLLCYDCGTMFQNMKERQPPDEREKWIRNYKIKKLTKDE